MKLIKFLSILSLTLIIILNFNACDETTSTDTNPVIESISPTEGLPGDKVKIYGSDFGEYNQTTSKVYFNNVLAQIATEGKQILWEDDEITAIVPQGATTGDVVVEVDGKKSNGIKFTIPSVDPAKQLMATSIDDKTVKIKWTPSDEESSSNFIGYWLFVYPTNSQPGDYLEIQKGSTNYTIGGLTEGTVYNFDLYAVKNYSGKTLLSQKVTIQWSPATRFITNINDDAIKLYESASTFGSGLKLYDETGGAPKGLKVSSGNEWDLGLYTEGSVIEFGSAKNILQKYSSYTGTTKKVEIASQYIEANSLDEVFDSQALSAKSFSERTFDLAQIQTNKNIVFIVRTNPPSYNYAKVMVLNKGGFLQGNPNNRYIEVIVSYQKVPGVPYAF